LNPLEREKTSIKSLENWAKPEYQKKQSDATTKLFNDPIIREKHKSGCKEAGNRPEKREELKQRALKNWQNPEYVKKNFKSQKKSPNNAEKLLDKIIQEILIDTYKFTGDGSMPIGTKKPDFTNIKGQMKLIELYGTGIHADPDKYQSDHILSRGRSAKQIWEEDFNRLQYLKSQGYEILIIWQKELRRDNIGKLKQKILEFNNIKN
jgi:very-short-patch-repair endonuclease